MDQLQSTQIDLSLATSYFLEPTENSKKGLLVLHGYADRANSARKRLLGIEAVQGYTVLSPNALFPCPVEKDDGFKEAYAWYFKDPKTHAEMISPEFAARAMLQLLQKIKLSDLDWTILGFSQGGFFAPHLIRAGLKAKTIIAVGSAYQVESYQGLPPIQVFAIHGENDHDVPFSVAQKSFLAIQKIGYGTEFHSIKSLGHTLNDSGRAKVREILKVGLATS